MTRRSLIAGNWKMNGLTTDGVALAGDLVGKAAEEGFLRFDMVLCPPATLLAPVAEVLRGTPLGLGGQDCHYRDKGAHTGDISAAMLRDIGCSHVIVGHSERRTDHGESDALVKAKAETAIGNGLVAIVCLGETEAERDSGETLSVVERQLSASLPEGANADNVVIAYEPVWAIGTGRTPTIEDVAQVHDRLRRILSERLYDGQAVRILYGGSVKPGNARELMQVDNVDGALVGGASLNAADFWAIAKAC
jgi:triosephosphate isomerase (TIM)